MRLVVFVFCLFVTALSFADEACVKEGESIGVYPGAVTRCCAGLEKMSPPPGIVGSAGTCHKKVNNVYCYGEGKFRLGHTMLPCCQGLTAFVTNRQLREFECKKVPSCVEENQQIGSVPGVPMVCCQGLQPKLPPTGMMMGATCVKPEYINCLGEGSPVFNHPGAPKCCPGLTTGKAPSVSPITFTDICVRDTRRERVNNSEQRPEDRPARRGFLRDDPEETSVSAQ